MSDLAQEHDAAKKLIAQLYSGLAEVGEGVQNSVDAVQRLRELVAANNTGSQIESQLVGLLKTLGETLENDRAFIASLRTHVERYGFTPREQ